MLFVYANPIRRYFPCVVVQQTGLNLTHSLCRQKG